MSEKIYCGNGKKIEFANGGHIIKLSLREEDLSKMLMHINEKGWVNVNVCRRREPGKTGMTHYLEVDQWKPDVSKKKEPVDPNLATADDLDFD